MERRRRTTTTTREEEKEEKEEKEDKENKKEKRKRRKEDKEDKSEPRPRACARRPPRGPAFCRLDVRHDALRHQFRNCERGDSDGGVRGDGARKHRG